MYEQRRPDVAVFIDFENVYVSVRDKLNANPNFEAIMDRCSDLGRVVISRAYADWYRYPRVTSALYANAIEPIYVATYYYDKDQGRTGRAIKNSVDMNLCIDAMKTLFTNTNISKFVLVTGDRDFIPLVNSIRQQGKEVYIIGIGGAASTHLAQSADEFVFYEQLVGRQPGGSAAATAIANRATELTRNLEPIEPEEVDEPVVPPARAPRTPQPASQDDGRPPRSRPARTEEPAPTPAAEPDIYDVLVEAIHLVRKRGYVSTLGSIKLVMKELMGGDFKESRYRDLNGRAFTKFKDFVMDAEKRGKVQIFTNGTVNEVFLPGEDPFKLSQFAAALSEETPPVEPVIDTTVLTNGRKDLPTRPSVVATEPGVTPAGRRRRRRSRRGQSDTPLPEDELQLDEELDEPEYTPPLDETPVMAEDELGALDAIEEPAEVENLFEEQLPEEIEAADLLPYLRSKDEPAQPEIPPEVLALFTTPDVDEVAEQEPEGAMPGEVLFDEAPAEPEVVEVEAPEPELPAEAEAEAPSELETETPVVEEAPEPVVDTAPVTPEELDAPGTPPAEDGEEGEEAEPINFSDEEWALFTTMMRGFTKPASFQQIFDTLRGVRKEQNLLLTNEQLRTMVKQAINSGALERSGRGKRVYYSLKAE
jgi:uncharacterized protein (TIGR00288 family)